MSGSQRCIGHFDYANVRLAKNAAGLLNEPGTFLSPPNVVLQDKRVTVQCGIAAPASLFESTARAIRHAGSNACGGEVWLQYEGDAWVRVKNSSYVPRGASRAGRSRRKGVYFSLDAIKDPKSVRQLHLNALGLSEFPKELRRFENLERLYLRANRITKMSEVLTKLPKLTELDLTGNRIGSLPKWFSELKQLEVLKLDGNRRMKRLSPSAAGLESLRYLNLPCGNLPEKAVAGLVNLETLIVDVNARGEIPDVLFEHPKLKVIDFRWGAFSEHIRHAKGLVAMRTQPDAGLPDCFAELQTLRWLSFMGSSSPSIPKAVYALEALEDLELSWLDIRKLPKKISKLRSLRTLTMPECGVTALPEEMGSLDKLEWLNVAGNRLKTLPDSLGGLPNLRGVNAAGNRLSTVPGGLMKGPGLTHALLHPIEPLPSLAERVKFARQLKDGLLTVQQPELHGKGGALERYWPAHIKDEMPPSPLNWQSEEAQVGDGRIPSSA